MGEASEKPKIIEAMGPSKPVRDMTPPEFRRAFSCGEGEGIIPTDDDIKFLLNPVEAAKTLNKNLEIFGGGFTLAESRIHAREVMELFAKSKHCDTESLAGLITKPNLKIAGEALCEAIIARVQNPSEFCEKKEAGFRTKYVGELTEALRKVTLTPPLRLALAGQNIPVEGLYGAAWAGFERTRAQVAKLDAFLKLGKNPVYDEFSGEKEEKLLKDFFNLPFVDLDFLIGYLWIKPDHVLGVCSRPDDLESNWEEKIKIGRNQARREKYARIKDNVDAYLPFSIKPEDMGAFEGIVLEKWQKMSDAVEANDDLEKLEYAESFAPDFFEAIMIEEHFGPGSLGKGTKKRVVNPFARIALLNMTLKHPHIHPNLRTSYPSAKTDTFGTYMMMGSVHDVLVKRYAEKYKGVDFPEYEKCLSFEEQTEAMMWLFYDNWQKIEKTLLSGSGVQTLIDEALESDPESVKRFFYFLAAATHKQGLSKVMRGIRAGLKKADGTDVDFDSFADMKEAVVNGVNTAIKKDRYPQDVVDIIDSLQKGREKHEN